MLRGDEKLPAEDNLHIVEDDFMAALKKEDEINQFMEDYDVACGLEHDPDYVPPEDKAVFEMALKELCSKYDLGATDTQARVGMLRADVSGGGAAKAFSTIVTGVVLLQSHKTDLEERHVEINCRLSFGVLVPDLSAKFRGIKGTWHRTNIGGQESGWWHMRYEK